MELASYIAKNSYPGRGIFAGVSRDGAKAVLAYFITGRSENSRNRVFRENGDGAVTKAFDESKVSDPSLIFYAPVRVYNGRIVVTNGDQTDTVVSFLEQGKTFEEALQTRTEEPDAPHFTPRISVLADVKNGGISCQFSILRRENGATARDFFAYDGFEPGSGRLIHTYEGDGDPLPTFAGAPRLVTLPDDGQIAPALWQALGEERRVALWVRFVDFATGEMTTEIWNRHGEEKA